MSRRTERIASQLLDEISRLLRAEVTDPRVKLVTLTRADVAPDLSHAVLYYSTLVADDDASQQSVEAGLASAATFLRRRAAHVLPLKRMPELRFRYDPSLALGSRTLALLREIAGDDGEGDAAPSDRTSDPSGSPDDETR
jgi:ribosome-binding factor A